MDSRYFRELQVVARLHKAYREHGSLFVAFDFDDTVYDFHDNGDTFDKVVNLLKFVQRLGFKLILFTAREGEQLDWAVSYCQMKGIDITYINENPLMDTRKPFYNILLDDKAGLEQAYNNLVSFLKIIGHDY